MTTFWCPRCGDTTEAEHRAKALVLVRCAVHGLICCAAEVADDAVRYHSKEGHCSLTWDQP